MVTDSDGRPQPRRGQAEWQKVGELTRPARAVLEPSGAPIGDQQRLHHRGCGRLGRGYARPAPGAASPAGRRRTRSHTVTRGPPAGLLRAIRHLAAGAVRRSAMNRRPAGTVASELASFKGPSREAGKEVLMAHAAHPAGGQPGTGGDGVTAPGPGGQGGAPAPAPQATPKTVLEAA